MDACDPDARNANCHFPQKRKTTQNKWPERGMNVGGRHTWIAAHFLFLKIDVRELAVPRQNRKKVSRHRKEEQERRQRERHVGDGGGEETAADRN